MKMIFHLGIVMRTLYLLFAAVVVAFFVPALLRRVTTGPQEIGMEMFSIAFVIVITLFFLWLSFYTVEIHHTEIVVKIWFPLMRLPIDQIRSFDLVAPILPFYLFGIDRDITGRRTARMVFAVHHQVRFMATVKERNKYIRFSDWNERRIARFLQHSASDRGRP